jgi:ribonuclease HI
MNKIIVYADESAILNGAKDSRCGWACKLIYCGHERMKSGSDIGKTNNQMEMIAVLMAMQSITDKTIPVELYSDSRYVIETLNEHFSISKNADLWDKLLIEKSKFQISASFG